MILWNTADWTRAGELNGLPGRVSALGFSADSQSLITASNAPGDAGEVTRWNTTDLAKRLAWPAHDGTVFAIALAPDGQSLATAGEDQLIRFWNMADGSQLKQIEAHSAPVLSLAFKPDGKSIASGGADKELKIWDTGTREQKTLITGHPGNVAGIAWPAKDATLITACDDGIVRVCTETGKRPTKSWSAAADLLHCFSVNSDGSATLGEPTTVRYSCGTKKEPSPTGLFWENNRCQTRLPSGQFRLFTCGCSSMVERKLPSLTRGFDSLHPLHFPPQAQIYFGQEGKELSFFTKKPGPNVA